MAESREAVIIDEDVLFRAIRDYKPTSSSSSTEQSHILKIRKVQPQDGPQDDTRLTYTPKIISIGPLHHGKPELQPMEDLKHKYINKLLDCFGGDELLRRFIAEARKMEEEVRDSYELSNTFISSDDFVHMLVIDGWFLLELLIPSTMTEFDGYTTDDFEWKRQLINHDILLFENQIPFFVLEAFYEIARDHRIFSTNEELAKLACEYHFFPGNTCFLDFIKSTKWEINTGNLRPYYGEPIGGVRSKIEPSNLLHIYHMMLFSKDPQSQHLTRILSLKKWTMALFSSLFVIVSSPLYFIDKIFFANNVYPTTPTSATEIEEAGVRLQGSRVDVMFEEGTLSIPVLTLNHQNLRLLKNLMIFEFYHRKVAFPYVHSYVSYLSDLIKKPRDLKVMNHIIITSGSEEESFRLVNDLIQAGFENHVPPSTYGGDLMPLGWKLWYSIWYDLERYCAKPRRRWRAKLIKDYFGNLWSTLGVLVAVILLVLTTLQTVFTVLSYYQ